MARSVVSVESYTDSRRTAATNSEDDDDMTMMMRDLGKASRSATGAEEDPNSSARGAGPAMRAWTLPTLWVVQQRSTFAHGEPT
ncbi:hypothetical protein L249_8205, partial [Ophiocordyceps polyrhachis-furcata BCC 54312]